MQEFMLVKKKANATTFSPTVKDSSVTLSNNNLRANCSNSGGAAYLTVTKTTGKWYAEFKLTQFEGNSQYSPMVGLAGNTTGYLSPWNSDTGEMFWYYGGSGSPQFIYHNNQRFNYGTTPVQGDVIGIALDADAKTIFFSRNGVAFSTIAWGTNNYSSATIFRPGISSPDSLIGATIGDFNQTPLYLPTGYSAW